MLQTTHELIHRVGSKIGLSDQQVEALLQPDAVHEFEVTLGDRQFKAYRSQHNRKLGPYKGGLRFHPKVTRDEAVALSTLMSLKTAAVGLPLGGGKGGIAVDPRTLSKAELEDISRQFVRQLQAHIGPDNDIPAPDVNTNGEIIDWMVDEYQALTGDETKASFTGKSLDNGGSLGREAATGRGGVIALAEYLKQTGQAERPLKIAVQGFGNVGAFFASTAQSLQPQWQIVAVSDSSATVTSQDLAVAELITWKGQGKAFTDFNGAPVAGPEAIFASQADVLVLAALDNAVTAANMHDVKAECILELANGPLDTEAEHFFAAEGVVVIPDIIANAGGVIVSYLEWLQNKQGEHWTEDEVNRQLNDYMTKAMQATVTVADQQQLSLKEAAIARALQALV
jgi:glutamate dehydrogenase/leucine dehydrogenase